MLPDEDSIFRPCGPTSVQSITDHPADALQSWFSHNGGWLNPDVRIVFDHTGSDGFHLVAANPLSSPTVATCPLRLTLSFLCLDHSQDVVAHIHSPLQKCLGKVPDFVLNYLVLMEQRCLGKHSIWHPYIACLPEPETMNTPIWFTDDDMECLQGTNLLQATKARHQGLSEQWARAQSVINEAGVTMPSEFSFDQFRWAATIFTSRAFISDHILPDRPTFPILFPVVDILNHSVDAKVEWDFHPSQSFALKILSDVKEGEELYNNYAPKQNDELLMGYGFCVEDNPMEQFAIRMMVPPEIVQDVGVDDGSDDKQIPFGMPPSSLEGDQMKEQHFLRVRGHPLGRYENIIPCLQGFAPYLVNTSFLVALHARQQKLTDVNFPNPGARIFLATLKTLHQAIQQRCARLPLEDISNIESLNDKQKYATIYRNGQAKVIHNIRLELKTVLDKRRVHNAVPMNPAIITSTEALFALKADSPDHYQNFKDALLSQWNIEVRNSAQYANDVATADVEDLVWVLLLIVFTTLTLTPSTAPDTAINLWILDLFAIYPLPAIIPTIHNPNYTHIHKILRKLAKQNSSTFNSIAALDDIGLHQPLDIDTLDFEGLPGHSGPIDALREKLILWALHVVGIERIELPDLGDPILIRQCLYVRSFAPDRLDENWIFEEFDIEGKSPQR